MAAEILRIPCLQDNYAWVLHDAASGITLCVDVPDAAPVKAALADRGWTLTDILLTHHHDDHIQGVADLRAATGAKVTGAAVDIHRLPALDRSVYAAERFTLGGLTVQVMDAPGHTIGHIAYYIPEAKAAFTGDSLMAFGCGRLFEGTAAQMWQTLSRLKALPGETMIYSGHEYSLSNARFALTIEPSNPTLSARAAEIEAARAAGEPTLPVLLATECSTNPFLRVSEPSVRAALGMEASSDGEVFAEIRARKDRF
ncbi:hydroxyacylglutathione hydrolase [Falsigemmobacter faecalis]|uniref:Hydroxyacylglutathione hydrolase n=1 Tax=Falsigemmobacter faecalis TaxID=2488730 RepID=A0A3P3DKU0_9RHOB|nr:hydroxyacylglutathione hydrolase [Falsigemmobacter faecalis]RRH74781.1 hydroxyacylglutathione hydrolase [Falsigemmobacter faecalis]